MTDLSAPLRAYYERWRKQADEAEQRQDWPTASHAHHQAAEMMRQLAAQSHDPVVRQQRLDKAQAHHQRATQPPRLQANAPSPATDTAGYEADVRALIHQSTITWDDIGGLEATKRDIKTAYGMALARQPAQVRLAQLRGMLFFGPPGTGKTLLAAATSNGLQATFFSVKISDLLSKYFGESSKLITTLYRVARAHSPAVIFFDEFEALTPQRGADDHSAERRMVATLLPELDGLATKDSPGYVLTIAATNLPWLIDKAVLSRFEKKVYIPLPDAPARAAILHIHLTQSGHTSQVPLPDLVTRTAGLAGRDMEQLCKVAINHMTQRANPDLLAHVDRGQEALASYQLRVLPLNEADWATAFAQAKPQTTPADLERFESWHKHAQA